MCGLVWIGVARRMGIVIGGTGGGTGGLKEKPGPQSEKPGGPIVKTASCSLF